ncbi:MAG: hypothetical protein AB1668_01745 [Nanoarchaeota archaeon]
MPTLIACLSTGKGTWTEVAKLIQYGNWSKVFLITLPFGRDNFKPDNKTELLVIDENLELKSLKEELKKQLTGKIADFEIALNFSSGSGKEHMAVVEAVLELGLNFRLVTFSGNQMEVLGMGR